MFMPTAGKMIATLVRDRVFKGAPRVVDIGNQTYSLKPQDIKEIKHILSTTDTTGPSRIDWNFLHKLENTNPPKKSGDSQNKSALLVEPFYNALGFIEYTNIDNNGRKGSLDMDLNTDLKTRYNFIRQFDLTTNICVSPHVFNQLSFFKNMHNLTKVGGCMLHLVPFAGFINHGFYNYQPGFFDDLARANGYKVLSISLADRENLILDLTRPNVLNTWFSNKFSFMTSNMNGNSHLAVILQKVKDTTFRLPNQWEYTPQKEKQGSPPIYDSESKELFNRPQVSFKKRFYIKFKTKTLNTLYRLTKLVLKRL